VAGIAVANVGRGDTLPDWAIRQFWKWFILENIQQSLLTAKYCPQVAAALCTQKKTPT